MLLPSKKLKQTIPDTTDIKYWINWFKCEREAGNPILFSWLPDTVTEDELKVIKAAAKKFKAKIIGNEVHA